MGLSQHELNRLHCRIRTRAALVAFRDAEFPLGLKGLVRESPAPGKGNLCPRTSWFITDAGRDLLARLATDENALPIFKPGAPRFQPYRNKLFVAQQSGKKRRRKRNQEKYDAQMGNPTFHRNDYEQMPVEYLADIHPNSEEFKSLSSLDRIRILRMRAGYTKPKPENENE